MNADESNERDLEGLELGNTIDEERHEIAGQVTALEKLVDDSIDHFKRELAALNVGSDEICDIIERTVKPDLHRWADYAFDLLGIVYEQVPLDAQEEFMKRKFHS